MHCGGKYTILQGKPNKAVTNMQTEMHVFELHISSAYSNRPDNRTGQQYVTIQCYTRWYMNDVMHAIKQCTPPCVSG